MPDANSSTHYNDAGPPSAANVNRVAVNTATTRYWSSSTYISWPANPAVNT